MKNYKKSLLSSAAVLTLLINQPAAFADDDSQLDERIDSSFYVSIFGGASIQDDVESSAAYNISGYGLLPFADLDYDTGTGFILGAALGARLDDNWRGEIEFAYQDSDVDNLNAEGGVISDNIIIPTLGDVTSYTILANLWYDVDPINDTGLRPYVGGGIGYGAVDIDLNTPGLNFLNGDDGGFAYQVGAGVTWDINEQSTFELGYRYKGITGIDLSFDDLGIPGITLDQDFDSVTSHNIIVGLRFNLK